MFWGVWAGRNQTRLGEEMAMLFDMWRDGRLKPLISERYTIDNAAQALAKMRGRGAIGKLVVSMD